MPAGDPDTLRPITLTADGAHIPLRRTEFELVVDGPFVTTRAVAVFHNGTGAAIEADLVIPLPPFASVQALQARWGQRALDGAVRGREAARGAYEAAVRRGRAAVLGEGRAKTSRGCASRPSSRATTCRSRSPCSTTPCRRPKGTGWSFR
ncbi:MAG: VIT domain-containing protein [Polyangiales bacterium]